MQQDARPARPQHHRHLPGGGGDGSQVDQRLAHRLVNRALPISRVEIGLITAAPAAAETTAFLAAIFFHHHRDIEADEGTDVGIMFAAGAHDLDTLPLARQAGGDLAHATVLGPRIGIHFFQQFHFLFEACRLKRIDIGIEFDVAAGRPGSGNSGIAAGNRLDSAGGAGDGVFGYFAGMRVAGGFSRHGAQAKSLAGVESGGLQPVVVIAERFGLAVFQVQFPVVRAFQGLIQRLLDTAPVHAGAGKEKIVVGHERLRMSVARQKAPRGVRLASRYRVIMAVGQATAWFHEDGRAGPPWPQARPCHKVAMTLRA